MGHAALWAVVLFHGWLLWQRITDLTLLEPLVALSWGLAALVLVGFVRLRRAGVPLFRGRRALAMWLLVLLLHAGAVPAIDGQQPVIESGLLLVTTVWGFGMGWILSELAGSPDAPRLTPLYPALCDLPRVVCGPLLLVLLSPRPPPT